MSLARCANCSRVTPIDELREVKNLAQRLEPGDTVPDGECPHCGAAAFAIDAIVVCPICGDDNIVAWYMEPQKSTGKWVREDDGTLTFEDDGTFHGGVDAEFDYYACATNVHELALSDDSKSLVPRGRTYDQAARAVREATEAWRPLLVERFAEQVRTEIPDAYQVGFAIEEFDNGPFLTIQSVWGGQGRVNAGEDDRLDTLRDLCAETLADLTTVFGTDLDELHLPDDDPLASLQAGASPEADEAAEGRRLR